MKRSTVLPLLFGLLLVSSLLFDSCKHPTEPQGHQDTTKCDTCHTDTTKHPCDTCSIDTVHHTTNDTSSHNFIWTEYTIPNGDESSLNGTCVFGGNHIYAVGRYLWSFDGTKWTERKLNTNEGQQSGMLDYMKIYAVNDSAYWLYAGGLVEQCIRQSSSNADAGIVYRLDQLQVISVTKDGSLHGAWGSSENDMFFVGERGTILHFDGENWINYPKVTTKELDYVWGTSHNNVWAAGLNTQTAESELVHFDGNAWSTIDLSTVGWIGYAKHGLASVWACDSAGHHITVAGGSLLWRKTDDGPWRSDSGKIHNRLDDGSFIGLFSIRGNNANDIMTAGDGGFISHWNGKSWYRYDNLYNPNNTLYGTQALEIKGNTACVVGFKNGSWIAVGKR